MDEWLNRDLFARLLSLAVAIILWFVVVVDEQGAQKARLQANLIERIYSVRLVPKELSPSLVVTRIPQSVDIRVRGSLEALRSVESRAWAEVNLFGRQEGDNLVRVSARVSRGLEVVSVEPSSIVVALERFTKKSLPVRVSLIGSPSTGYSVGTVRVEPVSATAKGPSGKLARVRLLVASVEVMDRGDDVTKEVPLQAVDDSARTVEGIDISPSTVQVFVPISRSWRVDEAEVQPIIVGKPASGYLVKATKVLPRLVSVMVGAEGIPGPITVTTEPLDISGAITTVQGELLLLPPKGVSLVEEHKAVVTVLVSPGQEAVTKSDMAESGEQAQ